MLKKKIAFCFNLISFPTKCELVTFFPSYGEKDKLISEKLIHSHKIKQPKNNDSNRNLYQIINAFTKSNS